MQKPTPKSPELRQKRAGVRNSERGRVRFLSNTISMRDLEMKIDLYEPSIVAKKEGSNTFALWRCQHYNAVRFLYVKVNAETF